MGLANHKKAFLYKYDAAANDVNGKPKFIGHGKGYPETEHPVYLGRYEKSNIYEPGHHASIRFHYFYILSRNTPCQAGGHREV